jgi:hypothetical protein
MWVQEIDHQPSKCKALSSIPSMAKKKKKKKGSIKEVNVVPERTKKGTVLGDGPEGSQ